MAKPKQSEIKKAAQKFVAEWKNRGKEDKDYTEFWEDLLEDVFAVSKARKEIEPQSKVKFEGTTKRIDIRVKTSKVVIEQKSNDVNLDAKQKQSGKDANGNPQVDPNMFGNMFNGAQGASGGQNPFNGNPFQAGAPFTETK